MQLELKLDTPLHRERDRPKSMTPADWSNWIDTICVRGGLKFNEASLLADLHRCCPEYKLSITRIADLHLVAATHWRWYWERWHPHYFTTKTE